MDHLIRSTSPIEELALPERAYHVLVRRKVRTVEDLVALTEDEMLMWRAVGPGTVAGIKDRLAVHGLTLSQPLPPPDPETMERARWLGHQLEVLAEDSRSQPARGLLSDREVPTVEARRYAWEMYRWAANGFDSDDWPSFGKKGSAWNTAAMPGSLDLHLEALNRIAHEELGS